MIAKHCFCIVLHLSFLKLHPEDSLWAPSDDDEVDDEYNIEIRNM